MICDASTQLLALQKRLYMQCNGQHLPEQAAGSLEQQRAAIIKAIRGKTFLVVRHFARVKNSLTKSIHQTIDDCWSTEHFNTLDVVDTSTNSKVLVSSRISGLLPGSTEVRLSLFTMAESVEVRVYSIFVGAVHSDGFSIHIIAACSRCGP